MVHHLLVSVLPIGGQKTLNSIIDIPVVLKLQVSHFVLFYAVFKDCLPEHLRVDVIIVRSYELPCDSLQLKSLPRRIPAFLGEHFKIRILNEEEFYLPNDSVVGERVQRGERIIGVESANELIPTLLKKQFDDAVDVEVV